MHLVIGGRGLIGSALCSRLSARGINHVGTTRALKGDREIYCDLTSLSFDDLTSKLPSVEVVYLVAAISKFSDCEGNALSWHVNVDAPLAIAAAIPGFAVFVSSDAVENMGMTAYARQKAHVEAVLLARGNAAIVRPSRVEPVRAGELADLLIDVGLKRKQGITRWR